MRDAIINPATTPIETSQNINIAILLLVSILIHVFLLSNFHQAKDGMPAAEEVNRSISIRLKPPVEQPEKHTATLEKRKSIKAPTSPGTASKVSGAQEELRERIEDVVKPRPRSQASNENKAVSQNIRNTADPQTHFTDKLKLKAFRLEDSLPHTTPSMLNRRLPAPLIQPEEKPKLQLWPDINEWIDSLDSDGHHRMIPDTHTRIVTRDKPNPNTPELQTFRAANGTNKVKLKLPWGGYQCYEYNEPDPFDEFSQAVWRFTRC